MNDESETIEKQPFDWVGLIFNTLFYAALAAFAYVKVIRHLF